MRVLAACDALRVAAAITGGGKRRAGARVGRATRFTTARASRDVLFRARRLSSLCNRLRRFALVARGLGALVPCSGEKGWARGVYTGGEARALFLCAPAARAHLICFSSRFAGEHFFLPPPSPLLVGRGGAGGQAGERPASALASASCSRS